MDSFLPGLIMGFREGLEAFLIIVIMIRYLDKTGQNSYKKYVHIGTGIGIFASLFVGWILYLVSNAIGNTARMAKIWESAASLIALALITTFIMWMIKNGANMTKEIETKTAKNLSISGIILISFVMVAREGVEIAIFTFAGQYTLLSILTGIMIALVFTVLIFYSLIKVNIKAIFNITLIYLILQAGFLLGYGIHEGLAALKDIGYLSSDSLILAKAFDLSGTILRHKDGLLGLPLYVLIGWYSKPEWIQFLAQYGYTSIMLMLWYRYKKKAQ
ncbi:FTR1 family protein [Oscillospiraceae bacterium PP1C4]